MFKSIQTRMATMLLAMVAFLTLSTATYAQSDITGVVTALGGYRDAAIAVGVAILLFVLGRTIVRKIAK